MLNTKLSKKLIIGGAQLGSDYGISNKKLQTKYALDQLLNYSLKQNINLIDSAADYKTPKNILLNIAKKKKFKIISKIPQFKNENFKDYLNSIEPDMLSFLKNNQFNNYEVLFIHNSNDLNRVNGNLIYDRISDLKHKKITKKIGLSVYNLKDCIKFIKKFDFDVIQIPINVFNQNFIDHNFFKLIKKKKIQVHARSIFMQGLIFIHPNKINPYFDSVNNKFKIFNEDCNSDISKKISKSLEFLAQFKQIDKYVVGFNNKDQLKNFLKVKLKKNNKMNYKKYKIIQQKYTNPSKWPK